MADFVLRPFQASLEYQGQYAEPAFDLLADPVPVYRHLLKFLGPYGVTLRDLKYETPTLAEASITCTLLSLSAVIRFRLDRCDVAFSEYQQVGDEAAMHIGLSAWAALQASDPEIKIARHQLTLSIQADLVKGTAEDLLAQYVTIPQPLGKKTRSAVFFYLKGRGDGEESGDLILDHSIVKDGALYLRFNAVYDGAQVPLEKLRERVDEFVITRLKQLGLDVETAA